MRQLVGNALSFLTRKTSLFALLSDRSGIGAVEFALIAPMLILVYIASFEITVGFSASRKVSSASATIADILTQYTSVNTTLLDSMNDVAKSVMSPLTITGYTLKMSGIKVIDEGKGQVVWSRDQVRGTPYMSGTIVDIPAPVSIKSAFIVRAEFTVPYTMMVFTPDSTGKGSQTITLSKTFYFRQRVGSDITCTGCS